VFKHTLESRTPLVRTIAHMFAAPAMIFGYCNNQKTVVHGNNAIHHGLASYMNSGICSIVIVVVGGTRRTVFISSCFFLS
jgi:hypothetical protein